MSKAKTATVKLGSFAKEVLARLAGDNNEALAQKIARKSMSAIQGQIASLKAEQVDAEMTFENAQEAYNDAKYPTKYNTNNAAYCGNLIDHLTATEDAQNALDDIAESIDIFSAVLTDFTDGTSSDS